MTRGLIAIAILCTTVGTTSEAMAAKVKITDKNGNCSTFEGDDISPCSGWSLAEGSKCKDLGIAQFGGSQDANNLIASLLDDSGIELDQLNNDTGLYSFTGLPEGDYTVAFSLVSDSEVFASFDVLGTTFITFSLEPVPEPSTILLTAGAMLATWMVTRRR